MSPPESTALLRAMDSPNPMPRFLNEIVGLKERRARLFAQARTRIVYFDVHSAVFRQRRCENAAAFTGRFGRVLQQVRKNALEQIGIDKCLRRISSQPAFVGDFGMRGLEERHPLLQQSVHLHRLRPHRRLGGELRKRPYAPLQGFDFVHYDLRGLFHEWPVGFIVARDHLFHREADGRERVLHLVRHLARQKLEAFELA